MVGVMKKIMHGIDLVDCSRVGSILERHGDRFTHRVLSRKEINHAPGGKRRVERLAGRIAAKEAIAKLLGTGRRGGFAWTDIEVVNDSLGSPQVHIYGTVRERASALGIDEISVSITHAANLAIASAVAVGDTPAR